MNKYGEFENNLSTTAVSFSFPFTLLNYYCIQHFWRIFHSFLPRFLCSFLLCQHNETIFVTLWSSRKMNCLSATHYIPSEVFLLYFLSFYMVDKVALHSFNFVKYFNLMNTRIAMQSILVYTNGSFYFSLVEELHNFFLFHSI